MSAWATETLIASGILMAAVLLLRRPVARLFGARAAYLLWLAPALRMALPPLPDGGAMPQIIIYSAPATAQAQAAVTAATPSLTTIALAAWLGGAALFLLVHAIQHHRFVRRAIGSGRRLPIAASGPELIESPAVEGPIATGVIRQRIFLPSGFAERLPAEQQRLAIAHERLHHSRGDLLALAVSMLVLALHWFNPLAHMAHRLFRRDLEAACDAELVERIGPAARADYARAIVGYAAAAVPRAICTLTTIDDLKRRLTMLEWNHGKTARALGLGCAGALALTGLALGASAAAPKPDKTETVEKKVIIREVDGDSAKDRLPDDLQAKAEKCDGQPIEATTDSKVDGKVQRTRIFLCGKGDAKQVAEKFEKGIARIESDSDMSPETKAKIVAELREKIAQLRAR